MQTWVSGLPPSQSVPLAPGEGIIYKRAEVTNTIYLEAHVIKVTPPFMRLALEGLQFASAAAGVNGLQTMVSVYHSGP